MILIKESLIDFKFDSEPHNLVLLIRLDKMKQKSALPNAFVYLQIKLGKAQSDVQVIDSEVNEHIQHPQTRGLPALVIGFVDALSVNQREQSRGLQNLLDRGVHKRLWSLWCR